MGHSTAFSDRQPKSGSCRYGAEKEPPMTYTQTLKTRLSDACSSFAWAIDHHLEGRGFGLFYDARSSRPWWRIDIFRDAGSWTAQLGKFELIWDRPWREDKL